MPRTDAHARSVCGIRAPGSRCICGAANRCERAPIEIAIDALEVSMSALPINAISVGDGS